MQLRSPAKSPSPSPVDEQLSALIGDVIGSHLSGMWPPPFSHPIVVLPVPMSHDRADLGDDRADMGGDRAEMGGDRADVGGDRAEMGGDRAEMGGDRAEMGGDRAWVCQARSETGQDPTLLPTLPIPTPHAADNLSCTTSTPVPSMPPVPPLQMTRTSSSPPRTPSSALQSSPPPPAQSAELPLAPPSPPRATVPSSPPPAQPSLASTALGEQGTWPSAPAGAPGVAGAAGSVGVQSSSERATARGLRHLDAWPMAEAQPRRAQPVQPPRSPHRCTSLDSLYDASSARACSATEPIGGRPATTSETVRAPPRSPHRCRDVGALHDTAASVARSRPLLRSSVAIQREATNHANSGGAEEDEDDAILSLLKSRISACREYLRALD